MDYMHAVLLAGSCIKPVQWASGVSRIPRWPASCQCRCQQYSLCLLRYMALAVLGLHMASLAWLSASRLAVLELASGPLGLMRGAIGGRRGGVQRDPSAHWSSPGGRWCERSGGLSENKRAWIVTSIQHQFNSLTACFLRFVDQLVAAVQPCVMRCIYSRPIEGL